MDGQTTNDELDFGASDSTTEQTQELGLSPEQPNEQTENLENDGQSEAEPEVNQVEDSVDGSQVDDAALEHFLNSKGIKLDNMPEEQKATLLKLGKMTYNSERQYKRGTQELAELRAKLASQGVDGNSPEQNQTSTPNANPEQAVKQFQEQVATWEKEKKLTPEETQKMLDWLRVPVGKNPVTGEPLLRIHLVQNGALTLDDAYNASGCNASKVDTIKEQMREEVKKEMAARQTAKRPNALATNSAQFAGNERDPFEEGLAGDLL